VWKHGGFRKVGRKQQTKYVVLYSSQEDRNWPDLLDPATGLFTYYGEITRRSIDGGRDAIGRYRLGPSADPITVDFALEAKCYRPELPGQSGTARQVGVKETARLISRLRHRQFGILVTTSYILVVCCNRLMAML
jgi:Restriction endonuclease AspBHI N-terminal/Restriction endonuclease